LIWYKYMESRWAQLLVEKGAIRINPLNYYKNIEKHGKAIGDPKENTLEIFSNPEFKTGNDLNEFEKQFVNIKGDGDKSGITFSKCEFTKTQHGLPTHAFCLSDTYSKDILEKMNQENLAVGNKPYDTCVKIESHVEFVKIISKAAQIAGLEYYGHGNCFYRNRSIAWENWNPRTTPCPAFVKPISYSWQREVRVVFINSNDDLGPIDIEIPEIPEICEQI